jgi:hypothetical protein
MSLFRKNSWRGRVLSELSNLLQSTWFCKTCFSTRVKRKAAAHSKPSASSDRTQKSH